MSTSIEIRQTKDGKQLECAWGVIEHGDPRPERGEVGELILCTYDYAAQLAAQGPVPAPTCPAVTHSVTRDGDKLFAHIDYRGRRWTWELFPAHWWDHEPQKLLVGRWPD